MTETMITAILAPSIATILGGLGWAIKRKIDQTIKERDERRNKIEQRQDNMEKDLRTMQAMLASCDNPDCKVRPLFAEYLLNRAKEKSVFDKTID